MWRAPAGTFLAAKIIFPHQPGENSWHEIFEKASAKVERAMKKRKAGTLKSGRSGKKVKSRKQAIAIGLSEAQGRRKESPEEKDGQEKDREEIKTQIVEEIENAGRPRTRSRPPFI